MGEVATEEGAVVRTQVAGGGVTEKALVMEVAGDVM